MNPDGSARVTVRVNAGVSSPVLPALADELLAAGITAGLIGAWSSYRSGWLQAAGSAMAWLPVTRVFVPRLVSRCF